MIALGSATALLFGYVLVVTTLFPADTPVVTAAQTREDGYQIMRRFLLASGATEPDDTIAINPLSCDGGGNGPRQDSDGYYNYMVLGGFRAVGDDQHEAFRRMYEHARMNGFTIHTYKNPESAPLEGRIKSWELTGGTSDHHGFGFMIFTVSPQTHVAIWVASTCRVTPNRDDNLLSPFNLPGLPARVPPKPPVWNKPTTRPPVPTPTPTPRADPTTPAIPTAPPAPATAAAPTEPTAPTAPTNPPTTAPTPEAPPPAPPTPPDSSPPPARPPASNTPDDAPLRHIRDILG